MEGTNNIKALFIVVNAGFTNEVMDIARAAGAGGATIINARGEGAVHKSSLGITLDSEKEMLLTLVEKAVAEKIMEEIKNKAGLNSPSHGYCFVLPVEKMTKITENKL